MGTVLTLNRSQDEILARLEETRREDLLGWVSEVLMSFLDYDHAKPFLRDDATSADWDEALEDVGTLDEAARRYYQFALRKIEAQRGISAERSVVKLREYAWLAGLDDVLAAMDAATYEPYGAPIVAVFGRALGAEEMPTTGTR